MGRSLAGVFRLSAGNGRVSREQTAVSLTGCAGACGQLRGLSVRTPIVGMVEATSGGEMGGTGGVGEKKWRRTGAGVLAVLDGLAPVRARLRRPPAPPPGPPPRRPVAAPDPGDPFGPDGFARGAARRVVGRVRIGKRRRPPRRLRGGRLTGSPAIQSRLCFAGGSDDHRRSIRMALTHWGFIDTADGSAAGGEVRVVDTGACRTVQVIEVDHDQLSVFGIGDELTEGDGGASSGSCSRRACSPSRGSDGALVLTEASGSVLRRERVVRRCARCRQSRCPRSRRRPPGAASASRRRPPSPSGRRSRGRRPSRRDRRCRRERSFPSTSPCPTRAPPGPGAQAVRVPCRRRPGRCACRRAARAGHGRSRSAPAGSRAGRARRR
ncbi:hypothetical protein SGLAM104S_05971 [Streptomyces glaucescens]